MNRKSRRIFLALVILAAPGLILFQNCSGAVGRVSFLPGGSSGQTDPIQPVKVSGDLVPGGAVDVTSFVPVDENRLVFLADKEIKGKSELYVVNRDGSGLTKLSGGGPVLSFRVAGESVFYSSRETAGLTELFRAPLAGGGRESLGGGPEVWDFALSADRGKLAFIADADTAGVPELFVVDLASAPAPALKLNPALVPGQGVRDFKWMGGRLLVRAGLNAPGVSELYVVDADASGWARVSSGCVACGAGVIKYDADAGGDLIVYLADLERPGLPELHRTRADGGGKAKLSQTPVFGGEVSDFVLTADFTRAIYVGDLETYGQIEIFQREVTGGSAAVKLSPALVKNGAVTRFQSFQRGGAPAVAFVADAEADDRFELFIATDLSAAARRVNGRMNPAGDVMDFTVSGDGERVAYVADQEADGRFDLFIRSTTGAVPASRVASGTGQQYVLPLLTFLPDQLRAVFISDLDQARRRELYVTTPGDSLLRLSRARLAECEIYAFKLSPAATWVAYAADHDQEGTAELFVAPVPQ